jgi:4-amino-4-deoxychorismate lyase
MMQDVLINGRYARCLDVLDRGFQYGDGVFETLLWVKGKVPLWKWHMQRLMRGCDRLCIARPKEQCLIDEVQQLAVDAQTAVVKILLTRGVSARGYAPPSDANVTRVLIRFPYLSMSEEQKKIGVSVRFCRTIWPKDELLAGIKHLNRLHQVMARSEWSDPSISEGICSNDEGHIVGATAANLFATIDGVCVTPDVSKSGIAGVCRAALLEQGAIQVRNLNKGELLRAQEIFLSNAVQGVIPVCRIDDRVLTPGPAAREASKRLMALGFDRVEIP